MEAAVAARVPDRVTALMREILSEGSYIGHAAVVLFALRFERRPYMWEGENRRGTIEFYAPWALATCTEPCAVDGVACVLHKGIPQVRGGLGVGGAGPVASNS
eukprot:4155513-Pyramimonas_sp.AAC.1